MKLTGWAITAGLGAAAGAVAIMMMPRQNPVRRLASKAANTAEDLAWKREEKMYQMDVSRKSREAGASRVICL